MGALTIDGAIHRQRLNQRATAGKLFKMPKPTIAALPGPAAGAGLSLALACDLRVMASTAILTTAFARVGFSGDYGGTYFLTQLVGAAKARELYFLSERVSADEALRLGLANWVCAPEELAAKTREIALRLAQRPDGRVSLHEGEPQPRDGRRGGRLPRSGSDRTTSIAARPRTIAKRPGPSSKSASRCSRGAEGRKAHAAWIAGQARNDTSSQAGNDTSSQAGNDTSSQVRNDTCTFHVLSFSRPSRFLRALRVRESELEDSRQTCPTARGATFRQTNRPAESSLAGNQFHPEKDP